MVWWLGESCHRVSCLMSTCVGSVETIHVAHALVFLKKLVFCLCMCCGDDNAMVV